MSAQPAYSITPKILTLIEQIGEAIGRVEASGALQDLRLRRINRIRTIHGTLAIEGNILSEAQVSTILDGKRVAAPPKDIQEARNAIRAYEQYQRWNPASETDLLAAHAVLMSGLLDAPGHYRLGKVLVGGQGEIHHIGPPAGRVPHLMKNLLLWLGETDQHPLIAGSVFHYEFEFIHPFEDGNGRMGRLWQNLILTRWNALFAGIPVENFIHDHQSDYYAAIRQSSAEGESTAFIAFMLEIIFEMTRLSATGDQETDQVADQVSDQAIDQAIDQVTDQAGDQVAALLAALRREPKTAAELMAELGLSHRPTFRKNYLRPAMEAGLVEMTRPESPTAKNQKYRRIARRGK
ncbi:MAG: Fic family protein [Gammaproteobacteria bacterium]|nr:Fic family protein [Gammaproteobacteria bacterium]